MKVRKPFSVSLASARRFACVPLIAMAACASAHASDVSKGIEQFLTTAQQDKRGVTLYVSGQAVIGAVVKVETGQWVEMKSQQFGRIVVRLDRIDGVAQ
jgi:hypothetical protein